jgi:hypothetical protein
MKKKQRSSPQKRSEFGVETVVSIQAPTASDRALRVQPIKTGHAKTMEVR